MAPKKSKAKADDHVVSEKDREAADTSSRLQQAALDAGVRTHTHPNPSHAQPHSLRLLKRHAAPVREHAEPRISSD